jgi:hypothetical protein
MIRGFTPRKAADIIQGRYNEIEGGLKQAFKDIGHSAEKEGVSKISLNKKILSEIKEAGPKTRKFEDFVDKAKSGDYGDLRRLQTELWIRANKAKKSPLLSDQDVGETLHDLRDSINNGIASHFETKGKPELADKLRESMAGYRSLRSTYHGNPTISKLVGKDKKVPKNLIDKLGEDSSAMKKIREEHPELSKKMKEDEFRRKLFSGSETLSKALGYGGIGYGASKLIDKISE